MFLFILTNWQSGSGNRKIQIHLMFLFIELRFTLTTILLNSNTSHVLIYQGSSGIAVRFLDDSNTSHVLIYPYLWELQKA